MIRMALQLVLILFVLWTGVLMQLLLIRQRITLWPEMVKRLRSLDGRLAGLSYHETFSADLAVQPDHLYDLIEGRRGLWAMYHNVSIFMDIALYVRKHCAGSRDLDRTLNQLRGAAADAHIKLVLALAIPRFRARWLRGILSILVRLTSRFQVRWLRGGLVDVLAWLTARAQAWQDAVTPAVESYLGALNAASLAVNDHFPDLMEQFRSGIINGEGV